MVVGVPIDAALRCTARQGAVTRAWRARVLSWRRIALPSVFGVAAAKEMLYKSQLKLEHYASARSFPSGLSPIGYLREHCSLGGNLFSYRLPVVTAAAAALTCLMMPGVAAAQPGCGPLPPASGTVVDVTPSQVAILQSILDSAQPGHTIQLADGLYALPQTLVMRVPGVTLRSKSGNRLGVVLDGGYRIGDVLLIQNSDVTIADVTLTRSTWHLVHVVPNGATLSGTILHNLRGVDGGEQFVKVNPAGGSYADNGVIRCSSLELTDIGRTFVRNNCYTGGVDIHRAHGWQIYANIVAGFWCGAGLSEHGIHVWTGSRDTRVEGNVIVNSARGIGFGLGSTVAGRTYSDAPCGGAANVGHYGGAIANNFVVATDARLFASEFGFDTGIGLEQSCETNVLHNTVVSTVAPRSSSIEWRFTNTVAGVANNLVTHGLLSRDGARATVGGNVSNAPLSMFVDVAAANLHLVPGASTAIDKAVPLTTSVAFDIDAEARGMAADVGADEYFAAPATFALSASHAVSAGGLIEVTWTTSTDPASAADWIGLYPAGAADSDSLQRSSTAGQATGTLFFTAPATAGTYETRYFSNDVRVAVSNPISVSAANPGDTVAPVLRITSPVNGQRVLRSFAIRVSASDNVGVTKVQLFVDGVMRAVSATAPFTTTWNPRPARAGAHVLQVKAFDAAGNSALSQMVVVYR
jgi:hypothetical protein